MWVRYKNGNEEFIEVKYDAELKGKSKKALRSIRQTNVQREWCSKNNKNYRIVTDLEIRENLTLLTNQKTILNYVRNLEINECILKQIINSIDNTKESTISKIMYTVHVECKNSLLAHIYYLIFTAKISSDIDIKNLDYFTEVWI